MRGIRTQYIQIHQRVYLNASHTASAEAAQGLPTLSLPYDEHPHEHS
jgi:hypothetical protein